LSRKQLLILWFAANGRSTEETAEEMGLSYETIKHHRDTLFWELRLPRGHKGRCAITRAVAIALRHGWIE